MRELRWLLRVAPPFAALAAVVALGSAPLRSTAMAAGCGGQSLAAATRVAPPAPRAVAGAAAFVIAPLLDASGTLAGQRVEVGTMGRVSAQLELPAESFAAGPFGRAVLVGADDGRSSTLRALDATSGCSWLIATETDVIRRATIDPAAGNVYEFRVSRDARADLGVWRRPLAGGPATQVLPPLSADDRFGPTFSTELSWSAEGDVLVAQSCGITSCRTRLLDAAGVRTFDEADQGEVIGLAGGRLIVYGACRGLPCPVSSIDTTTGAATAIASAAGAARLVVTTTGPRLLAEVGLDADRALVLVDPASAARVSVPIDARDWHLVPNAARAGGALATPPGWALLTRDGSPPGPGDAAELLDLENGATLDLMEVTQ